MKNNIIFLYNLYINIIYLLHNIKTKIKIHNKLYIYIYFFHIIKSKYNYINIYRYINILNEIKLLKESIKNKGIFFFKKISNTKFPKYTQNLFHFYFVEENMINVNCKLQTAFCSSFEQLATQQPNVMKYEQVQADHS